MIPINRQFGRQISQKRKSLGISQTKAASDLSERTGLTLVQARKLITRIEVNGKFYRDSRTLEYEKTRKDDDQRETQAMQNLADYLRYLNYSPDDPLIARFRKLEGRFRYSQ